PYLSAMFTAALWLIGRNSTELRTFATKLDNPSASTLLETHSKILPDFHLFYVSGASLMDEGPIVSVHEGFVGWGYIADALLYALVYAGACLSLAAWAFSRRDLT